MSKFWTVVTIIFVTAIMLLALDVDQTPDIAFSDLETECRYDKAGNMDIGLDGRQITFSGRFNTPNSNTNLDYSYRLTESNKIRLNIITRDSIIPDSFYDNCLASVVYEAKTESLEPGDYSVTVSHNGNVQKKSGIRVK